MIGGRKPKRSWERESRAVDQGRPARHKMPGFITMRGAGWEGAGWDRWLGRARMGRGVGYLAGIPDPRNAALSPSGRRHNRNLNSLFDQHPQAGCILDSVTKEGP